MATQEIWNDIDVAEVVREVKVRLIEDAAPGLGVFADFARERGVEDQDCFDPRVDADLMSHFDIFLEEKVTEVVNEEIGRLAYDVQADNGLLTIYRSIVVPKAWGIDDLDSRPLGVCWSWEKQFAVPYSGGGDEETHKETRLTGKVELAYVDWVLTVALNAQNAYWGEDEREIRLGEDASVDLFEVEVRPYSVGDFNPAFNLEGKTFAAADQPSASFSI
jgi:hypothetical protein